MYPVLVISAKKHPKNKMESAPPFPRVLAALPVNLSSCCPPFLSTVCAAATLGGRLLTQVPIRP